MTGGGNHDQLPPMTETVRLFGGECRCVTLPALIRLKRAAGRPRDLEAIAELESLEDERGRWTAAVGVCELRRRVVG